MHILHSEQWFPRIMLFRKISFEWETFSALWHISGFRKQAICDLSELIDNDYMGAKTPKEAGCPFPIWKDTEILPLAFKLITTEQSSAELPLILAITPFSLSVQLVWVKISLLLSSKCNPRTLLWDACSFMAALYVEAG